MTDTRPPVDLTPRKPLDDEPEEASMLTSSLIALAREQLELAKSSSRALEDSAVLLTVAKLP